MKTFIHRHITGSTVVAFLIAGFILLCQINSPHYSVITSYGASTISAFSQNAAADSTNSHNSKTHPGIGNHATGLLTVSNYSIVLSFIALFTFVFFSYQLLFLKNELYLTKLNYFRHRYRIIIKPKFEKIFLRWLNLLGGTIVFGF